MFIIRGKYIGQPWEDIDEFDTPEEAARMLEEYRFRFDKYTGLIKRKNAKGEDEE